MLDLNQAGPQHESPPDFEGIRRAVIARIKDFYRDLFPNGVISRDDRKMRLADITGRAPTNDGSCEIELTGDGVWIDRPTGQGGGFMEALEAATRLRGIDAWQYAADWAGVPLYQSNGRARSKAIAHTEPPGRIENVDHTISLSRARQIVQDSVPAAGTLAETYLQSRGLDLPDCADLLFHPDLTDYDYGVGRPGMVAIVRRADTGEPTGAIHQTMIAADGGAKADTDKPKKMLGPCKDGVVRLMSISEAGVLGIGEGIETSLAGAKIFGVPAWAALSAGGMRHMPFPQGLKRLLIFIDRGKDGEAASAALAQRALAAGIEVQGVMPHSDDDLAKDFALSDHSKPYRFINIVHPADIESTRTAPRDAIEAEIIPPTRSLEDLMAVASRLTRSTPATAGGVSKLVREVAAAELDPVVNEELLSIIKERTRLPIAALREMLKSCRREIGADSRTVVVPDGKRVLQIGSDVEIAECVADDLRQELGEVVYTDGDFWRYADGFWQALVQPALRCAVHEFDGAVFQTPAANEAAVQLSKARVDSVLHEMGAKLAQPDFFAGAPAGINCASGFIAFAADGTPNLLPHDQDHRCRHVLPGRWQPKGADAEKPPAGSLLARLLDGVFKGDTDIADKRKLVAETAGAAAVGYGTKLRQPKAVVCVGETAGNGKSQVLDAIRGLLPVSAISSIPANKFGDERHIINLRGKLLNASDELSGQSIKSDTFKSVVTGNPVTGRDVYRSAIEFRPVAQQVYAANKLPKFDGGMDRGVQRRLLPLAFNRVIPVAKRVEDIGQRIGQEEPDLLLAFAVAGAARLIRRREFTIPASSKSALQQWVYMDNPILAWVTARVDPAPMPRPGEKTMEIKSREVHAQFRTWAVAEGFDERKLPDVNGFVQQLKADVPWIIGKHTNSGNWLRGLTISPVDRPPGNDTEVDLEAHLKGEGLVKVR